MLHVFELIADINLNINVCIHLCKYTDIEFIVKFLAEIIDSMLIFFLYYLQGAINREGK